MQNCYTPSTNNTEGQKTALSRTEKSRNSAKYYERGGIIVEICLLAPLLLLVVLYLNHLSTQVGANSVAQSAAQDIARSAALEPSPQSATALASELETDLRATSASKNCREIWVTVDTTHWNDGWIHSHIECVTHPHPIFSAQTIKHSWTEPIFRTRRLGK